MIEHVFRFRQSIVVLWNGFIIDNRIQEAMKMDFVAYKVITLQ